MLAGRAAWLAHPLFTAARQRPAVASALAAMVAGYPGQHWTSPDPHLDTGPRPLRALDELAMPVLVAVGEHDVPGFREMSAVLARGIPAAQYHVVPDAGHMINMEQPGAVNALLTRFLESSCRRASRRTRRMTMESVMVAAVQAAPVLLDRDATIGKVSALAEQAAGAGARLVAFPEAFIPGYPDWVWRTRPWDANATALYARLFDQAVVVGSAATDLLAGIARRLGIWLSVGPQRTRRGRLHHLQHPAPLRAGRRRWPPGTASSCPPAASGWSGAWATARPWPSPTPASAGSAG